MACSLQLSACKSTHTSTCGCETLNKNCRPAASAVAPLGLSTKNSSLPSEGPRRSQLLRVHYVFNSSACLQAQQNAQLQQNLQLPIHSRPYSNLSEMKAQLSVEVVDAKSKVRQGTSDGDCYRLGPL